MCACAPCRPAQAHASAQVLTIFRARASEKTPCRTLCRRAALSTIAPNPPPKSPATTNRIQAAERSRGWRRRSPDLRQKPAPKSVLQSPSTSCHGKISTCGAARRGEHGRRSQGTVDLAAGRPPRRLAQPSKRRKIFETKFHFRNERTKGEVKVGGAIPHGRQGLPSPTTPSFSGACGMGPKPGCQRRCLGIGLSFKGALRQSRNERDVPHVRSHDQGAAWKPAGPGRRAGRSRSGPPGSRRRRGRTAPRWLRGFVG